MKKSISVFIIFIFAILSNIIVSPVTYWSNWIIEDEFDLNFGPAEIEISLWKIDNFSFKKSSNKSKYNNLKKYDTLIREQIMFLAREWVYDSYELNGIIMDYKNFIYYTNRYFYFLSILDKNPKLINDVWIQEWYLKSYKSMADYYKKTKFLINYWKE